MNRSFGSVSATQIGATSNSGLCDGREIGTSCSGIAPEQGHRVRKPNWHYRFRARSAVFTRDVQTGRRQEPVIGALTTDFRCPGETGKGTPLYARFELANL